jgi:hypothetical protein
VGNEAGGAGDLSRAKPPPPRASAAPPPSLWSCLPRLSNHENESAGLPFKCRKGVNALPDEAHACRGVPGIAVWGWDGLAPHAVVADGAPSSRLISTAICPLCLWARGRATRRFQRRLATAWTAPAGFPRLCRGRRRASSVCFVGNGGFRGLNTVPAF